MHSSILFTSVLAVGALALPQGQLEKRQQVTVFDTVTVTVTVFRNPYTTPAWQGPPQFSQTPASRRPTNAPPAWTPPRLGNPTRSPVNTGRPSPTPSPGAPVVSPPGGSVGTPLQPSPSSVNGGVPPSSPATPAPSGAPLDPGHTPGEGQASLSAGLEYQKAILFHHNAARANHGADPLVWDDAVARTAAVAAQTCRFEHLIPRGVSQGQNLFTVSGRYFNVTAGITEGWYKDEFPIMSPYFGAPDVPRNIFPEVGHLTQILWKGTTRVGCVSIDCGNRMIVGGASSTLNKYTVCNYAPPGNVGGQFANNVGRPIDSVNLGSWRD